MKFHTLDYAIVALYFLALQYIGFVVARRKVSAGPEGEFILAGRSLTLPLFVATLVATWYGSILGVGEFVYSSGIVAWVCFGLPYYIAAVLFAVLLAGKIRATRVETIPEQITSAYGPRAGLTASILILIITIPASYVLMVGVLIQLFTGWALWQCIALGSALSIAYLYKGGFRSDVYANVLQFVLMYVGFFLLLGFAIAVFGAPGPMLHTLPPNHLHPLGGMSWQYVAVWFIIAFQTFVDPSFHQRCAAARTPALARRGILVSVVFWIIFDFLTLACGLYARAYVHGQALMAYPILGERVLPTLFKGIFVVGMLAPIMSALNGYGFVSAITIGKDILASMAWASPREEEEQTRVRFFIRIGLILTGVLSISMAIVFPSVVQLIYLTASVTVPGLLFPLVVSFSTHYTLPEGYAIRVMIPPALLSALWIAVKLSPSEWHIPAAGFIQTVEPMLPGILLSGVLVLVFLKRKEPVHPATREV